MPFYQVDTEKKSLQRLNSTDFKTEEWRERQDLQPLLRDNPEVIDSSLFIISEEFSNWEDSKRRIDLLGLDEEGNLVVIELKRVEGGGHMELQSLRYAAMVSAMDFDAVVNAHEQFLNKLERDSTNARLEISKFLGIKDLEDGFISNTPRIILLAPSFSQEITTTVLWLNEQKMNIRCIEVNIYDINNSKYLNIEQLIPLPSATDYQIKISKKTTQAVQELSRKQRNNEVVKVLTQLEILKEGMRVYLISSPRKGLDITIISDEEKRATFNKDTKQCIWDFDGKPYSLSMLCKIICERHNIPIGSGAFRGSQYWAIDGESKSLSELAEELSETEVNPSVS